MSGASFGLYLHWPFCKAKCPYCDFNSHVRETVDEVRWRNALLTELDHWGEATPGRRLDSIFFGGGTPSLMAPETVAALIERARQHWHVDADIEITLEANPTSVEAGRFRTLAAAGVNRLSLGVQSLNERALAFLGRKHSVTEALHALELARAYFPRFSFDLIYARPNQSEAAWREELAHALDLAGGHLSLYQLTIEENTPFHGAWRRGELRPVDDSQAERLFAQTQEMTARASLPAYEISNHARLGQACRHNMIYWQGGDYLGVGPGAHGRVTLQGARHATRQHRAPEAWLAAVEANGHADARAASTLRRRDPGGTAADRAAADRGNRPPQLCAPLRRRARSIAGAGTCGSAGRRRFGRARCSWLARNARGSAQAQCRYRLSGGAACGTSRVIASRCTSDAS